MNFYDFHIGDYASRTGHLEPMEDLAYRRMLDLYYIREAHLPIEVSEIARLTRLRGQEAVIKTVLAEFFTLTDNEDGWEHDRCEAVIAAAKDKRMKAKASADKRWDSGRNANAMPTHSEGTPNAMPVECEGNAPSPSPSPSPSPIVISADAEKPSRKKGKTKLPEDFAPDETGARLCVEAGFLVAEELPKFRNHHEAAGTLMANWQAGFRTWIDKAKQFRKPGTVAKLPLPNADAEETARMLAEKSRNTRGPSLEDLERMNKARKAA